MRRIMNRLITLRARRLRVLIPLVAIAVAVVMQAAPAHAWINPSSMTEMETYGNQPAVTRTFSTCDAVHHRLDVETLLMFNHQRFPNGTSVKQQDWYRVTDQYGNPKSGWYTTAMSNWMALKNPSQTIDDGYVGFRATAGPSIMWTPSEIDWGTNFRGPVTLEVWAEDVVWNGSATETVWSQSNYHTTSDIATGEDTSECYL